MSVLYVVATPIGNLGDMSPRALETLRGADLIAAEDTRVTLKLLNHFDIHTRLVSCHQHNEENLAPQLADRIAAENLTAALVTDAGTPAISDPGTCLVKACAERGIPVYAVPGPTAMASALSVSGLDLREFAFYGFLPREKKDLMDKLGSFPARCRGAVFHESPYRIKDTLRAVCEALPKARVSVSCDLTKLHELTLRGTPAEVLTALEDNEKSEKGEYCVVMDLSDCEAREEKRDPGVSLEARLMERLLQGMDLRQAKEALTSEGEKKNAVYAASIRVKEWLER